MTTFDLFSSVRDGNTDIVRRLLQSKQCRAHLNDRNEWGDTALHLAAEAGNAEICQMLIAAGASVTVRNNRGETCLHRAAVGGHVNSVRAVVGRDQDPDAVNSQNDAGYTALHHAAKHGSRDLIDILVKAGADRMIENNAGETPYMVAHKFQQWEAEKLLLNVELEHADRAVREMNHKEKDIIQAYLKAVKYANHLESRVRIVLIGDRDTGKTSLKKTIFGELHDPEEKPTFGIHADSSITRIQFKQYREWVMQPASKADVHRLNLQYTDIVIDFILNFLQQPRITDDPVDPRALQVEKGHVKSVNFDFAQHVIPDREVDFDELDDEEEISHEGMESVDEDSTKGEEGTSVLTEARGGGRKEDEVRTKECLDETSSYEADASSQSVASDGGTESIEGEEDGDEREEAFARDSIEYEDDRLRRFAEAATESMEQNSSTSVGGESSASTQENSLIDTTPPTVPQLQDSSSETTELLQSRTSTKTHSSTMSTLFSINSRAELSRLLVEKVPLETLKRMVIRWPVGDEQHRAHTSDLASKRLMITVWDVAGDPVQQNFTPLFFSDRCLFLPMFNLTKSLDAPCTTYERRGVHNFDGSTPTNSEVLESWIGCATAFAKHLPANPFRCSAHTPVLPPLILTCSNIDQNEVRENPVLFHRFFERASFPSYRSHLIDCGTPSALGISNSYESCQIEDYSGHHLLRREIDHLARQMPYTLDNIPIQWVKFEQLIYGLQEQRKVVLLYEDLAKYVAEHCRLSGPLQVLPVLAHFHDVGIIAHFYRHPDLSSIVFTKPQWLIDALSALVTSHPGRWVTTDVQNAFAELFEKGTIDKDMLQLAYRCARMSQRYWNEVLFVLNCMDLICCHPSLHQRRAIYLPCMVIQSATPVFEIPADSSPRPLLLSAGSAAIPVALFNQLVVRCIRASRYAPVICNQQTHIQLNSSHHLILTKKHTAIEVSVGLHTDRHCAACSDKAARSEYSPRCANIRHLIGEDVEYMPCDNIATIIRLCEESRSQSKHHLALSDKVVTPDAVCPRVLAFVRENVQFLCHCWFPGLELKLAALVDDQTVVLDECWKHNVLKSGAVSFALKVWFS